MMDNLGVFGAFNFWIQFQGLLRDDVPPAFWAAVDVVCYFARFLIEPCHRLGEVDFFDITFALMIEFALAVVSTIGFEGLVRLYMEWLLPWSIDLLQVVNLSRSCNSTSPILFLLFTLQLLANWLSLGRHLPLLAVTTDQTTVHMLGMLALVLHFDFHR